jgi:hypothetical protein
VKENVDDITIGYILVFSWAIEQRKQEWTVSTWAQTTLVYQIRTPPQPLDSYGYLCTVFLPNVFEQKPPPFNFAVGKILAKPILF